MKLTFIITTLFWHIFKGRFIIILTESLKNIIKFDFITPSFDVLRRFLVSTSRLKNKYVDYMFYPPIDTKINEHVCKSIKQGQTHKVIKTRSGKAHFLISYNWEIIINDLKSSNVMASNKIKRGLSFDYVPYCKFLP